MQTIQTATPSTATQSVRPPLSPEVLNALLTTPVKTEAQQQARYYVKQPLSKGRQEGAANYNAHDTDLLLDIIERIKPVGGMLWQKVEEQFNAKANIQRPLKSLKEKFKSLRLTRYSTGDPHMPGPVRRAKQLYNNILSEHKVGEIGNVNNPVVIDTSPESSPPATTSSDSVASTAVRLSSLRLSAHQKHPRNESSPPTTSASDTESTTTYTSAHKRRRRLEDAVFAIAESCKRDTDNSIQNTAVVSMLNTMQQQQQSFMQQHQQQQQQLMQQLLHASQQQQQFQAQQQQQQQQFFIQLMDRLTHTHTSTQQQNSDQS